MASSEDAKAETLKRLFETFRSQDRDVAEALIADSFTFTSPYDDAIDKQAYFEKHRVAVDQLGDPLARGEFVFAMLFFDLLWSATLAEPIFEVVQLLHESLHVRLRQCSVRYSSDHDGR